jgi:hypothetical protein
MIKIQVQLPDELYQTAKAIALQREWSLAELIQCGLEHMAIAYPVSKTASAWKLPVLKAEQFVSHFDDLDFKAVSEDLEAREIK